MCFSATASFTASAVLTGIGYFTVKAAAPHRLCILGYIPLLFALQQFLEGIVWLTLMHGDTHSCLHIIAVYGFLFFAGIFWPVAIPATLMQLEHHVFRRKLLKVLLYVGVAISLFYLLVLLLIGSDAQIVLNHIAYPLPQSQFDSYTKPYGDLIYFILLGIYVYILVASCFTSSIPYIWIFGLLVGIGLVLTGVFYAYALGSVWCYFGAISSIALYFIVKKDRNPPPA